MSGIYTALMKRLLPAPLPLPIGERVRVAVGAALGLLITAVLSLQWSDALTGHSVGLVHIALVAPIGASAVLLFALATGPMSQPWSVLVGNTVSALVGIACARLVPVPLFAAALAVGFAVGLMFLLRALHPPGGAMALLAVLTGQTDFAFALYPVALDSGLLVLLAWSYHSLCGRPYLPNLQRPPDDRAVANSDSGARTYDAGTRFTAADLEAALSSHQQLLDVGAEDLQAVLARAETIAYSRRMAELLCRDLMSSAVVSVQFGDTLAVAWDAMRQRRVKALPVVDRARRIVGIVTQSDFLRHAGLDKQEGLVQRIRDFVRKSPSSNSDQPEVVGQIMTRRVRVSSADKPLADLVPLFSKHGHHHIPIVDAEQRLVGIITQTDMVRMLAQLARPATDAL